MSIRDRWVHKDSGQGLVEYGLILALVSAVAVGALGGVGDKVSNTLDTVGNAEIHAKIEEGYIPVATADELNNIRKGESQTFGEGTDWESEYESGLDKKYIQVVDIDLSNFSNWDPIGPNDDHPFTGDYDGGGYRISNLSVNRKDQDYVGLFGMARNGEISNVRLENATVIGGPNVGGIAGYQMNHVISECAVEGFIKGRVDVGGVVGSQRRSVVSKSYVKGNVESTDILVGGITGHQWFSSIDNSYMVGDVVGSRIYAGGLVGAQRSSTSTYSYMVGTVSGGVNTGALIGHKDYVCSSEGSIYNSDVSGELKVAGGHGHYLDDKSSGGVGKTTVEMKSTETYKGWNQTIWGIQEGAYPKLRWENE